MSYYIYFVFTLNLSLLRNALFSNSQLSCDPTGVTLRDLLAEVVMEERMCSYRVYLASSRALLDLDADAGLVDNATIRLDGETISDHPDGM